MLITWKTYKDETMQKLIYRIKQKGDIVDLLKDVQDSMSAGATEYKIYIDKDPSWPCQEIHLFHTMTPEEIKQDKIEKLTKQLEELKAS